MAVSRDLRWALAVLAIGLALVALYAWPGYMAYDSLDQLQQARRGRLTDWHPPIMSALWGQLDRLVAGPALMLILQCSLFLIGTFGVLRRFMALRPAALWTLAIFGFPPTLTMMAVVVKDALMAGALLAGCAALTSERRWVRWAACLPFALATGLRYNAVAIVVPLVALLSPWPSTRGPWVRAVVGGALALAITGAAWLGNRALTDVPTHPFHVSVAPMDVIGTLRFSPPLDDATVRGLLEGVPLAGERDLQARAIALYDPNRWWGGLLYGPERFMDEASTPAQRAALGASWWRLIRAQPRAYLESRLDMFGELLGLTDVPFTPVYEAANERAMLAANHQPAHRRNLAQRWLANRARQLGRTSLMFRPYAFVLLALVLAVLLRRHRMVVALLTSVVANLALLFVASPAPDVRYVHWLFVVVSLAVALRFSAAPSLAPAR